MRSASTSSTARCPSATPAASSAAATALAQLRRHVAQVNRHWGRGLAFRVFAVGGDDALDELVADDVLAAEVDEGDVLDRFEDVADDDEAGALVARQVDLGDVAGDDHARVEAEPGQEHLHLLGAGVLRLVEDDEGVVEGVVRNEEIVSDVERVGRRDLDAHRLRLARRLDRVYEAHRATAAVLRVALALSRQPERLDPVGQPDVEDEGVRSMVDWTTIRPPGRRPRCLRRRE